METVIAAVITGGITLIGVLIANGKTQAVMETKVDELTREVREHNNFAKRMPVVEEQIKVINHRIEEDFVRMVGDRVSKKMEVSYVFQEIDSLLPEGFEIPEGRKKPWGTAHAILCCKDVVKAPFGAINSDDYYGKTAFQLLYDRLCRAEDGETYDYCMVGYRINNTLTDHGSVARGICETDAQGNLVDIQERLRVVRTPEGPAYLEDETDRPVPVPADNLVSMNFFGFTPSIFGEIEARLPDFFANTVPKNPEKAEIYIPVETGRLLREGKATVEVMATPDKWIGVTYREDLPGVQAAVARLKAEGVYPARLWDDENV